MATLVYVDDNFIKTFSDLAKVKMLLTTLSLL